MKEKDWSDPQPDFTIQPKARELLHMEREYFTHHIWSKFRCFSISQPRSKRKYLEDYSTYLKEGPEATRRTLWLLEVLKDALPSTRRLQDSATKSSGAYQTRGSGTTYRHRMFWSKGQLMDVPCLFCNYSDRCRTSHSTKETTRPCCIKTSTVLG